MCTSDCELDQSIHSNTKDCEPVIILSIVVVYKTFESHYVSHDFLEGYGA